MGKKIPNFVGLNKTFQKTKTTPRQNTAHLHVTFHRERKLPGLVDLLHWVGGQGREKMEVRPSLEVPA